MPIARECSYFPGGRQREIMYEERFVEEESKSSIPSKTRPQNASIKPGCCPSEEFDNDDAVSALTSPLDALLFRLWDDDPGVARLAASTLYAPRDKNDQLRTETEAALIEEFLRRLYGLTPSQPIPATERIDAVSRAARTLIKTLQIDPRIPFLEERAAFVLRPIGKLTGWWQADVVCELLYDLYRGIWAPHLTKPQGWSLRDSIARALCTLRSEILTPLWNGLESDDALRRGAMLLGIEFLNEAHAIPSLLYGLGYSRNHVVRSRVVNYLEQIGDASSLPRLAQIRRETAYSDWTLSRQIARAMRVIERSSQDSAHRILLRPALAPTEAEYMLLRPAAESVDRPDMLLRPAIPVHDENPER